ncbi:MAG: hypothetical protein B6D39_12870 [Anaerolineae bacterium UTCFX2]|nr:hypothetical protein [Anaerolineales bacterium]OQY87475.1 MAG: hypothetical protein B6D39_12870 [Anaerolineae bacterium UTCFX2]
MDQETYPPKLPEMSSLMPQGSQAQPPHSPAAPKDSRLMPAFWTIASIISITVNIILIVFLLMLATQLFQIKELVQVQVIDGLYQNFVKMDEASIVTTIQVSDTITVKDTIPVVFDLPLKQGTEIILTKDTPIRKATVYLNGQPVPTDIILRQGTHMSIALDMIVPVNQTIPVVLQVPVNLQVPVHIPLSETELHEPFSGLRGVVAPYKQILDDLPDSWGGLFCKTFGGSDCKP